MIYFLLFLVILANAFSNIFIKIGVGKISGFDWKHITPSIIKLIANPFVILGIVLLVASFPIFAIVLQKMNLSVAYPALVVGAIAIVVIFSFFFFKESISLAQLIGLVLVFAGIWLLFRQ